MQGFTSQPDLMHCSPQHPGAQSQAQSLFNTPQFPITQSQCEQLLFFLASQSFKEANSSQAFHQAASVLSPLSNVVATIGTSSSMPYFTNFSDVVTEFIKGLVETYHGLQYLDGFPEVKVVLCADVSNAAYDKFAIISGFRP
nr:putative 3,4-dihydroxy-2-butanone kinase [Quercus suber]